MSKKQKIGEQIVCYISDSLPISPDSFLHYDALQHHWWVTVLCDKAQETLTNVKPTKLEH